MIQPAAATVGMRASAYLIDLLPAILISFGLGWAPVDGSLWTGLLLLAWWLLRDITGSSPGKHFLGIKVVRKDGTTATLTERILRNVTLIAGPVFVLLQAAGIGAAPVIAICLTLVEVIMLFVRKERLGDMLARTAVVVTAVPVKG